MPPAETKVNQRYCKLLSETFEKYKDINVVKINKYAKEDGGKEEQVEQVEQVEPQKIKRKHGSSKVHLCNLTNRKYFSRDEDQIIIDEMGREELSYAAIHKLAARLSRDFRSIQCRADLLRKQKLAGMGTDTKLVHKRFTLQEDMLIIDEVIEDIKECGTLQKAKLANPEDLYIRINRTGASVSGRWIKNLKPWLLQYYTKTLNLEIRPMLTNAVAESYESVSSIDWEFLCKKPEFSGHTPESLSAVFSSIITRIVTKHGMKRTDLTLKQVAKLSNDRFDHCKVKESTKMRQQEIIKYFENLVKKNGIANFI